MLQKIRLTDAQVSALQCSRLFDGCDDLTPDEDVLRLSVQGRTLIVSVTTQEPIARAVCELTNAEDAAAETNSNRGTTIGTQAARAYRALSNLHSKVLRLTFGPTIGATCEVRGVPCRITALLPAGIVEVEATDGSGRCWRVSGLEARS